MDKKAKIIEAARILFTEYGYKKVSMDEIAKQANVTKRTIYHYFKDKNELFQYFVSEELETMKKVFEAASEEDKPISEKIINGLQKVLKFREEGALIKSIIKEEKLTGIKSDFISQYDSEIIAYIEEKINKGINEGNIRKCNANLTAFIIYKVFYSIFFEYHKSIDEKEVIDEVSYILQNGIIN